MSAGAVAGVVDDRAVAISLASRSSNVSDDLEPFLAEKAGQTLTNEYRVVGEDNACVLARRTSSTLAHQG
jgi:hypothetical protein